MTMSAVEVRLAMAMVFPMAGIRRWQETRLGEVIAH